MPETMVCASKMIADARSMIACISEMVVCGLEMTGDVARTIVSVAEMIESVAGLIADGMEIVLSQAPTVMDDVEIIVQEMELTVTMMPLKGKTGRKEAGEPGVCMVKQSTCLVWIVVIPFMPPYSASRLPFLTRCAF